ncbi:MAG: hypothetical protein OEY34_08045, partial [Cyclobacteriaceae bacterium]|nr:hypothetical protein [Cyclobacteriaceae bacterium]
MRYIYYYLLTAAFLLTVLTTSIGQRIDFNSDSGFDIGFGLGGSYQQSEVRNSSGTGYDFRFGHSIYRKPEAFFSLDWRFRFLAGQNKAFDDRVNTDGTYNNVKYIHFNYDFELVLTLNRLLNKTGIILSGFAGTGIAHSISKFDNYESLLGTSMTPYDYSSINLSGTDTREQIYQDLLLLSDNDFETKGINKASITPTAGIYLGYQLAKHFSIGIEHKTNFFLKENNHMFGADIDGIIDATSPKDRNHYTSLIFKWDIGRGSGNSSYTYTPSNNTSGVTVPCYQPVVNFKVTEINSNTATHELVGTLQNINYLSKISVRLDGQTFYNFQYDEATKQITSLLNLSPGEHTLMVTAKNNCGEDTQAMTVFVEGAYQAPCILPVINTRLNEIQS